MEPLDLKWIDLEFLLDSAMYEAFADYDMTQSIRNQAIAVFGHERKPVDLPSAGRNQPLRTMLNGVVRGIKTAGAPKGYGVVHITEQGHELAVLTAFVGADKAICALKIERGTGDPMLDLQLVTNIPNGDDFAVLEPSPWAVDEPRCEIDIQIPHKLFS